MRYEIAVEGDVTDIDRLHGEVIRTIPGIEKCAVREWYGSKRGRLVFVERERCLDDRLLSLSHGMAMLEERSDPPPEFEIHVRDIHKSEPPSGTERFTEPFNPIPGLTVLPWSPERTNASGDDRIVLDPGYAFGTGKHPTTQLCLSLLAVISRDPSYGFQLGKARVVDLGCGTGLLAIAAVRMGAHST